MIQISAPPLGAPVAAMRVSRHRGLLSDARTKSHISRSCVLKGLSRKMHRQNAIGSRRVAAMTVCSAGNAIEVSGYDSLLIKFFGWIVPPNAC